MSIPAVVEGYMESVFLPIVLEQLGRADLRPTIRNAGGGSKFWPIAVRYNEAGNYTNIIGLADLEQAACAPTLLASKLPQKAAKFHLRLAVRMLESWLMADRQSLAAFLRIPIATVPADPDNDAHPKRRLVEMARRSTSKVIREAMIPDDSGSVVGADYVATMCRFITEHWQCARARQISPSLERACNRWVAIDTA
ncbi:MAG: hypothetical protein KF740_14940 [Ramlibacter sp.]|nr:hypothetical protein [Ramlibacter sp.]